MAMTIQNEYDEPDVQDSMKIGIDIQNMVNDARRRFAQDEPSIYMGTQTFSGFDVTSGPGLSSIDQYAWNLAEDHRKDLVQQLDARTWIVRGIGYHPIHPTSTSSRSRQNPYDVSRWITYIRSNLLVMRDREQLADRLSELATEHYLETKGEISSESLAECVMFLSNYRIGRRPYVGVTDQGYISCLWRNENDELVDILFLPGDESQVVTFSRDFNNPEKINHRSATLPIKRIFGVLIDRKLDSLLMPRSMVLRVTR